MSKIKYLNSDTNKTEKGFFSKTRALSICQQKRAAKLKRAQKGSKELKRAQKSTKSSPIYRKNDRKVLAFNSP